MCWNWDEAREFESNLSFTINVFSRLVHEFGNGYAGDDLKGPKQSTAQWKAIVGANAAQPGVIPVARCRSLCPQRFPFPHGKECLLILLRGSQPIIICPARSSPRRVPTEWQSPLTAGRLLILSPFAATENRITANLASRRNELVAALANEVWFTHVTPSGEIERLSKRVAAHNSVSSCGHLKK